MKKGNTIIHIEKGKGKIGMVWQDEKGNPHGKVVNSLKEGLELLSKMVKEHKALVFFSFLYGDFGMRLPTEEVENDPILSSLPSQNCITLIRDHKE